MRRLPTGVAATLLVVMWSSGFIGAELGTRFAPADTLLAWRYVAAALIVGTWAAVRGIRPDRRTWPRLALVGLLCQCLYLGGVVTGVGLGVPPGTAALVAALQPLLVAVVAVAAARGDDQRPAARRPGARRRRRRARGGQRPRRRRGPAAGLRARRRRDALAVGRHAARAAARPCRCRCSSPSPCRRSPRGLLHDGRHARRAPAAAGRPGFWWAVLWVVALSTFGGYGCYLLVLRRSGATRVSTLLFLTPPTTALWAFLMFGTRPGLLALPGAAVCALAGGLVVDGRASGSPSRRRA